VHQILMNLISNAIHYTDQGRVEVSLRADDGCLTLCVQDTGRGIAPEEQGQIFREFYRVDETRPLHDGLGLGLSIVQRLCQLIEARIELVSERGQGARFVVRTPYRWLSAAALPSPGSTASASVPASASVSASTPELAPNQARIALKGCVVAVIEDDPVVCEAYRQTLASRGAQVVLLPDDPQALLRELELIDQLDLIVSDYRLRTTTGDRVIQTLRESFNREVPAIIVTADTSPSHIHQFQRLNIPVLHKPASFQQIIDAAEKALTDAVQGASEAEASASTLSL